jgi:hypothetical protein
MIFIYLGLFIAGLSLFAVLHSRNDPREHVALKTKPEVATPAQQPSPAQPVAMVSAHESRLAELRKKREGIDWQIAIELEMAKKLVLDADDLSTQRFPDPGERQFLMDKMDQQHQRLAELEESKKAVDAEIAKEEGAQQPNSEPTPASGPSSQATGQPADTSQSPVTPQPSITTVQPPVNAASPTSGVLCNGPVEVQQNWEFTFRNLPGDRLKLTFDHDAWLPLIHREPDGTQTLIMRSIKPGIQTKCDIRWEIVQ